MLIGAHFPVKPSLLDALRQAEGLGLEAVQIFAYRRHEFYFDPSLNQEKKRKLDQEIKKWNQALKTSAIKYVAVHSRAVATLAAGDAALRKKTVAKFKQEIELAGMLGARCYVFHLGPYSDNMEAKEGLNLASEELAKILQSLPKNSPMAVLENVPGGGRRMGSTLEELAKVAANLKDFGPRFGICLDFAHLWSAGYEISSAPKAKEFWMNFKKHLSPNQLALLHLNNSKLALGCHLDQHEHLADGHIPSEVYRYALAHWQGAAAILETPKSPADADQKNVNFLKSLIQ